MPVQALFDGAQARALAAGEVLFHAGDPVSRVYLVREGLVHLLRPTAGGGLVILQAAGPGTILSEASVYSDSYHCDAQAVLPAVLAVLPRDDFRAQVTARPDLADAWAGQLAHAVQRARLKAEIRTLRTVAERLDAWVGASALPAERGRLQDLAAELGVTREALYRELSRRRKGRGPS